MPPSKKTKSVVEEVVEEVVEPKVRKPRTKKSVDTPVVDTPVETPVMEQSTVVSTARKTLTPDEVLTVFDELSTKIETDVTTNPKSGTVKLLRNINKQLKQLKQHYVRLMKQKTKTTRKVTNSNSGFKKPVKVSKEMCKFAGWDQSDAKSRVDVTNVICKYIKDRNLQNPEDRRQILVDDTLKKLLKYDPAVQKEPLTYFSLQVFMKPLFELSSVTEKSKA
jgi:chromatin remodeling complex protein RSC6